MFSALQYLSAVGDFDSRHLNEMIYIPNLYGLVFCCCSSALTA